MAFYKRAAFQQSSTSYISNLTMTRKLKVLQSLIVLLVVSTTRVSAGGGDFCEVESKLVSSLYQILVVEVSTIQSSCLNEFKSTYDSAKSLGETLDQFQSDVLPKLDQCFSDSADLFKEFEDSIAQSVGLSSEALHKILFAEEQNTELPVSCVQNGYNDAYTYMTTVVDSFYAAVTDYLENY